MNIAVIRGNPRIDGTTAAITERIVTGAREAGASIVEIGLQNKSIHPCLGCFDCWVERQGRCSRFRDGIDEIMPSLDEADLLLLCSPVYFSTISSMMKVFLERLIPLLSDEWRVSAQTDGGLSNRCRWKGKKIGAIMAGAYRDSASFENCETLLASIAHGLSSDFSGAIIRPESHLIRFTQVNPKAAAIVDQALIEAGKEIALEGRFSDATKRLAATPFTENAAQFNLFSQAYWKHRSMQSGKADHDTMARSLRDDMALSMQSMALRCPPSAIARVEAVMEFHFVDRELYFTLTFENGTCRCEERQASTYTCRITTDTDTWKAIIDRTLSAQKAYTEKKIVLDGDRHFFYRLPRYFPGLAI